MQNKFGLKDFVLLVMIVIVGVMVFAAMWQEDRRWDRVIAIEEHISNLEGQVSSVESRVRSVDDRLAEGVVALKTDDAPAGSGLSRVADDSWARPGIPIEHQGPYTLASDPRQLPDFRAGGEFFEVFEAQPAKLTAVLGEDTYSRRVQDLVLESLAVFDPQTLALTGVLAEAWQYDPDGYWLRVKIRDEARFSDGTPVTAEDVRWTFHDFINNPELETVSLRSIMNRLERVDVLGDKVCEFHFTQPDAYNLQTALVFGVLPKHMYERYTPQQINESTALLFGSGPFMLRDLDWAPGEDVVLVRNERYWGPKPALDQMRFRTIDDDQARLISLTNGETDMIRPSAKQFVEKTSEEGWQERFYSLNWINMRSGYSFIGWQCGERNGRLTPFHDKRVRLAMTQMLDREAIIRDIYDGIGKIAVGPNNPPSPAADPSIKPWPYDLNRSRDLLREAGWWDRDNDGILENEDGTEFSFEFTRASGGTSGERIQQYLVGQCAKMGIRCTPRVVDWALYDQILKTRDFDAITLGWAAGAPESDLTQIWHTSSIQNQGHNFIQWSAGQDPIIEAVRSTLDFDKRMEHFHDFHRLVHEEQPYTFLMVQPWLRFVSGDFENVNMYPSGLETREFMYAPE